MSMLTCCPVCSTMFKVVPDQLRISQGWVRCGRCAEVFDATAHLQDRQPALPRPPAGLGGWPASGVGAGEKGPEAGAQTDEAAAALLAEALAFAKRTAAQEAGEGEGYSGFTLLRADDANPVREGDSGLGPLATEAPTETCPDQDDPTEVPSLLPEDEPEPAVHADAPLRDDLAPVGFVQQARRRDLWRRPGVRAVLSVAGVLLAALLVVQYALHGRDALAARAPVLAGPLRALCAAAGCTVGAPRQIDAVVIDSTTFSKLRADGYRLSITLKNTAPHPVAMPAVELTLTDSRDLPVLRRVLTPEDLGARSSALDPAAEWSGTLRLTVLAGGNPARVSGYRVLAFYP